MKLNRIRELCFIIILAAFSASADEARSVKNLDFMREVILTTYTGALQQVVSQNQTLLDQLEHSCDGGRISDLEILQQIWIATYLKWKQTEAYMLGPVTYLNLRRELAFWPTRELHIQKLIHSEKKIDRPTVEHLSIAAKGYPALEWIFFEQFPSDLDANKQQRYCQLSRLLAKEVQALIQAAAPAYQDEEFLAVLNGERELTLFEYIYNQDPFTDWLSTIVSAQYEIRKLYLIRPAGLRLGTKPQPDFVDARLSGQSLQALRMRWQAVKAIYLGTPDSPSLVAFVAQSDETAAQVLRQAIDEVDTQLEQLPVDNIPALAEHHRDVAEALAEKLLQVETVLQNEIAAALQTPILFTDDDGD